MNTLILKTQEDDEIFYHLIRIHFWTKQKQLSKVVNNMVPQYIKDLFQFRADTLSDTSLQYVSNKSFAIPKPQTSLYKESLS